MKPCKIILRDYFKVYDDDVIPNDDEDDDLIAGEQGDGVEGEVDDGYEDSSELVKPPERRTGPIVDAQL